MVKHATYLALVRTQQAQGPGDRIAEDGDGTDRAEYSVFPEAYQNKQCAAWA
jgi:hypothetical protein